MQSLPLSTGSRCGVVGVCDDLHGGNLRKKLEGAFVGVVGNVFEVKHHNVEEIERLLIPQLPDAFTFFLLPKCRKFPKFSAAEM